MIPLHACNGIGECPLYYFEEPPTMLNCSPYQYVSANRQEFRLRVVCSAKKNIGSSVNDSFDLTWYWRRASDETVENLGPVDRKQDTEYFERIDMSGAVNLSTPDISEGFAGEYWCQVVIANNSGQFMTIESNSLTVLRPENYTGLSFCNDVQLVNSSKCALVTSSISTSQPEATPSPSKLGHMTVSSINKTGGVVIPIL